MKLLDRLTQWKRRYGDDLASLERLLNALPRNRIADPASLIRLHEALLFFRAYPHSVLVARLAEEMLRSFSSRVATLSGDTSPFEEAEVSGIAGTSVSAVFTYDTARSLADRHGNAIDIDWEWCSDLDRIGPVLAAIAPMAREEWPVEAHVPVRKYVDALRTGNQTSLQWLLKCLYALPLPPRQRAELYDRMSLMLTWRLGASHAARTLTRIRRPGIFVHKEPLIPRRAVSIEAEMASPPLPIARLSTREAGPILDLILDTSAVRYRELYGFNHPDLKRVYRATAGRGVEIYFFGVPPEWRLPLRAYHAGMFFKNGVPAGYVEVLSFFERAEVGFNLYYTFREGETAWLYARLLRLCRQLLGVTRFALDPYQIGHENEEAIASGAFWFYRKLGFRSVDPALARLTESEERRIAKHSGHLTPPRTLRKFASRPMIYEPPGSSQGDWDSFHIRNLALAPWPASAKRAFDQLRPAKHGPDEARYLLLMQSNPTLRAALLRLGSSVPE